MQSLDPQQRLALHAAIIAHDDAQNCTVYRPDESDPDAEEEDLGDGKIILGGTYVPPAEWDQEALDDYYDDSDPSLFVTARIASDYKPGSADYFEVEPGDFVATLPAPGKVQMYFVYDYTEDAQGREYVLIDQERVCVEIYRRGNQGWTHETLTDGALHLDCLGLDVPVAEIYADIDWSE